MHNNWRGMRKVTPFILTIPLLAFMLQGCTVVKTGSEKAAAINESTFDANGFVNEQWEKSLTSLAGRAKEAAETLQAVKADVNKAGASMGIRSMEGSPWNFVIKGKGKVLAVATESRAGTMDVDLPPYDNQKDLTMQVGPVFKGSSIRDSVDFIKFDHFKNQIQYAQLANAFNKKVLDEVISKVDLKGLAGQEIDFTGTFAAEGQAVMVTPVQLAVSKGGQ